MKYVRKIADNFEGYICVVMLAVMCVVVFMQVVCRFILKSSLPWSEEMSRYLQVYITFFGTAYGIKTGAHLGIEAFVDLLPQVSRKYLSLIVNAVSLVVCIIVVRLGVEVVMSQMSTGQVSPSMRIPMWQLYIAIPLGMFFSCLRYIQLICGDIRTIFHKGTGAEETEVTES